MKNKSRIIFYFLRFNWHKLGNHYCPEEQCAWAGKLGTLWAYQLQDVNILNLQFSSHPRVNSLVLSSCAFEHDQLILELVSWHYLRINQNAMVFFVHESEFWIERIYSILAPMSALLCLVVITWVKSYFLNEDTLHCCASCLSVIRSKNSISFSRLLSTKFQKAQSSKNWLCFWFVFLFFGQGRDCYILVLRMVLHFKALQNFKKVLIIAYISQSLHLMNKRCSQLCHRYIRYSEPNYNLGNYSSKAMKWHLSNY